MAKRAKAKRAPGKTRPWSKMHVRSLLYKHYKNRYPNWKDTKADAETAIQELKSKGYKRASKKAVLEVVKVRRLQEIEKKKEKNQPKEDVRYFFQNHPHLIEPIPFYEIERFCNDWAFLSTKVIVESKYIWTTGIGYRGGSPIPYDETFRNYTQMMEKLQSEPRRGQGDYTSDWFYLCSLEKSYWDSERQAYIVLMITCDSDGQKSFYFGEEEQPEKKPAPTPAPEKPVEPEERPEIPEAKPAPSEITPEIRAEIEKEKVRAEAKAKYESETEIKKEKIKTLKELLKEGIISKEDFFREFNMI